MILYVESNNDKFTQIYLVDQISSSKSNYGKSPTSSWFGLTNIPYLSFASKYFIPLIVPLPSPNGSSNFTPTQYPLPKSIHFPTKQTCPLDPLSSLHLEPF